MSTGPFKVTVKRDEPTCPRCGAGQTGCPTCGGRGNRIVVVARVAVATLDEVRLCLPRGGEHCICGGRSDRFPDSDYPCRCVGAEKNPACTCVVNPGGQDGVYCMHTCWVHNPIPAEGGSVDLPSGESIEVEATTGRALALEIGRQFWFDAMVAHGREAEAITLVCGYWNEKHAGEGER